jgi:hypothetical protein
MKHSHGQIIPRRWHWEENFNGPADMNIKILNTTFKPRGSRSRHDITIMWSGGNTIGSFVWKIWHAYAHRTLHCQIIQRMSSIWSQMKHSHGQIIPRRCCYRCLYGHESIYSFDNALQHLSAASQDLFDDAVRLERIFLRYEPKVVSSDSCTIWSQMKHSHGQIIPRRWHWKDNYHLPWLP